MALILLVDDDSSMRHFLGAALTRAGYEVEVCADGEAALQVLQTRGREIDLLLTDIVMPGMDGIKLSQHAADMYPELKIMYITGFSGTMMERDNVETQGPVMAKPFHLKDLVGQIAKLLPA